MFWADNSRFNWWLNEKDWLSIGSSYCGENTWPFPGILMQLRSIKNSLLLDFMNHFNSCHDITNMLLQEFCNVFVGLYFLNVSEASVGILDGKLCQRICISSGAGSPWSVQMKRATPDRLTNGVIMRSESSSPNTQLYFMWSAYRIHLFIMRLVRKQKLAVTPIQIVA